MSKLTTRDVSDLDTLRHMNLLLREVRAREAGMEGEMDPVRVHLCLCLYHHVHVQDFSMHIHKT